MRIRREDGWLGDRIPLAVAAWLSGVLSLILTVGNPALGQGMPAPATTSKAVPIDETAPANAPAPRAVPIEEPSQVPGSVPKALPVNATSAPDKPTSMAPAKSTEPGDDIYDYASLAFERGEWEIAREALAKYLQSFPQGRHGAQALMRIGECYRSLNQENVAEAYFEEVVTRHPKSDVASGAAYRLAALRFNNRQYESAAKYFDFCEQFAAAPEVRLAAAYNLAASLQMIGDNERRAEVLKRVLDFKGENPYREKALLSLGTLKLALRDRQAAESLLKEVLDKGKDNALRSEATSKLGALYTEMGKHEQALPLLNQSLADLQAPLASRQLAALGLMQALSALNRFDELGKRQEELAALLPPGDTRLRLALAQAHGLRQQKNYKAAAAKYGELEPVATAEIAFEAGYWKLYCHYLGQEPELSLRADEFIQRYAAANAAHEWINFARLIKADDLFSAAKWELAAGAFAEVRMDQIPPALLNSALFNKAWSQAEAGKRSDAIGSFGEFLQKAGVHELRPRALARRAVCLRELKDVARAVSDFREVVDKHPNSDSAEFCLLQLALMASEGNDHKASAAAFEQFLNKYPNSSAAALAWFELGRSAYAQQQWPRAKECLSKALKADPKGYGDQAAEMIIQVEFAQQNVEGLGQAIDEYRAANPKARIASNVATWLGLKHFAERRHAAAARYLEMASSPEAPDGTDPRVWNYLSQALLESGNAQQALESVEHYLRVTPEGPAKVRGLVTKGRALLKLAQLDKADAVAQEGLAFAKDGRPQAMLLILEGDILAARAAQASASHESRLATEHLTKAAAKYMVPAEFFEDDELTPEALRKLVEVLDKAGEREKAERFRAMLNQLSSGRNNPTPKTPEASKKP